jgi:hypothetical protein
MTLGSRRSQPLANHAVPSAANATGASINPSGPKRCPKAAEAAVTARTAHQDSFRRLARSRNWSHSKRRSQRSQRRRSTVPRTRHPAGSSSDSMLSRISRRETPRRARFRLHRRTSPGAEHSTQAACSRPSRDATFPPPNGLGLQLRQPALTGLAEATKADARGYQTQERPAGWCQLQALVGRRARRQLAQVWSRSQSMFRLLRPKNGANTERAAKR